MTQQAQLITIDQQVIELDFEEGQDVVLLAGAQIGGLTTRTNQPGRVVKVLYSDEFGLIYCVAFGTMQKHYARVSAEGLTAVAEAEPVAPEFSPQATLGALIKYRVPMSYGWRTLTGTIVNVTDTGILVREKWLGGESTINHDWLIAYVFENVREG